MFTKSYTSLRRLSAYVLALLLLCVCVSKGAEAQASAPPVTGSFATSLAAPTGLGTVEQTVLDSYGDWLVLDYPNGALYEYPANGGAMITLAPPGTLGGVSGYDADGMTLDSMNNIYLDGNFNNCLVMFPYDTSTKTWDGFATLSTTNTGPDQCGTAPFSFAQYGLITPVAPVTDTYFQPWGLATLPNNVLVIGDQKQDFIFTVPVTYPGNATCTNGNCSPTAAPGSATLIILSLKARPNSVAADKFGNIYFVEDTGGLPGAYMIPAGQTNVPSDGSSVVVRVDPMLANVKGVATDPSGNVYISDSVAGVFMVPNPAGTPNTAAAVTLTTVPATGQVSVDTTRGILYVPTTNNGLTKVTFNAVQFGATATGTPAATSQSVLLGFNSAQTPASFTIQEAGAVTPDFTIATGGTCAAGTAFAAQSGCTENVTLSPHAAGNVSAQLLILGASSNILGAVNLQGTGTGSAIQVMPGGESAIGAGLKTPKEVAVDAAGNTYVADSGLGAVLIFPKGYGASAAVTTIGTGLTAPTGVAVDGAGDVFIADSGNVIEVPEGPGGLSAAGQVTLKSGLGANLNLATDGLGHLFIADPTNSRVVELANLNGSFGLLAQTETDLTTGFNAPSVVAVDASGNLYVVDGANLIEVTSTGTQSTLLSTVGGATGLAVDPSGAVYVAMPGATLRIPNQGGTLNQGAETTLASNVTDPTSLAIDSTQNVYITDGVAEDVEFVSSSATTNFGTLSSTTGTQSNNYTILDAGNAPLNVTGFTSTLDYSETATSCIGTAVAVGSTCTATLTFNPGPGDQGTLTGDILIQGDEANSPVGVNVTGVGASLAASTTAVSVTNATVDAAPAVITVTPSSGTGIAPTGQVTLTISGNGLTMPVTLTGALANGTVTIASPPQLSAGNYTFSVSYQGDRTYGPSNASAMVTIAVGAVTLMQTPLAPAMSLVQLGGQNYVLANGTGADEPYDGSIAPFLYTYPVTVLATDGAPLIGQPIYDTTGTKVIAENYGTVTYQGAPAPGCEPVAVASNGTAPLTTGCLAINTSNTSIPDLQNTYTITPVYSPAGIGAGLGYTNPNYAPVTGTPITLTALRNPVVQITSSASSLAVSPGSTTTATLTLTSLFGYGYVGGGDTPPTAAEQEPAGGLLNNYSLPVQLACDGLPAYATCTFSYPTPDPSDPNSVAVGPVAGTVIPNATNPCTASVGCGGPGTVIMTISTNIPAGVASLRRGPGKAEFAALFGLGLFGFAFGRKRTLRGRLLTVVCLFLCTGVTAGISGCSTKQFGTNTSTATPAGTYAVLVTAKQVGSRVIMQNNQPFTIYGNGNQMSLPFTVNVTIQ